MSFSLNFLLGPTASGKTELALRWAEWAGAELLYCDAFCVYRGMDVGTAKPTPAERVRVPHHGIDLVGVDRVFSVAEYIAEARRVVEDCRARGVPLLVTGGTGFYARSFFHPVVDETPVPAAVRERVRAVAGEGGAEALLRELTCLNPAGVTGLDIRNPRRLAAALERCLASGRPLVELQKEYAALPEPFPGIEKRLLVISRPREELDARIARRTAAMLEAGLVDEVRRLRAAGIERNPSAAAAIGYRETLHWLDHGGPVDELAAGIALHTRQLVKKQFAFFRNQLPPARHVDLGGTAGEVDVRTLFG